MSDVLSKLGESLKTTIKEATQQTQKSVDQVTCRTDLLNKKNELKRLYEALGEVQYKAYIDNEDNVERNVLYSKITNLKSEIESLETKLEEIVNTQKSSFDNYKKNVKTTWSEEEEKIRKAFETHSESDDDVKALKVCPVCHTANHMEAAYCIKCGNKFV